MSAPLLHHVPGLDSLDVPMLLVGACDARREGRLGASAVRVVLASGPKVPAQSSPRKRSLNHHRRGRATLMTRTTELRAGMIPPCSIGAWHILTSADMRAHSISRCSPDAFWPATSFAADTKASTSA